MLRGSGLTGPPSLVSSKVRVPYPIVEPNVVFGFDCLARNLVIILSLKKINLLNLYVLQSMQMVSPNAIPPEVVEHLLCMGQDSTQGGMVLELQDWGGGDRHGQELVYCCLVPTLLQYVAHWLFEIVVRCVEGQWSDRPPSLVSSKVPYPIVEPNVVFGFDCLAQNLVIYLSLKKINLLNLYVLWSMQMVSLNAIPL